MALGLDLHCSKLKLLGLKWVKRYRFGQHTVAARCRFASKTGHKFKALTRAEATRICSVAAYV